MELETTFYFSVIDCQSLDDISKLITKFDLEQDGNTLLVKIELEDSSKMELGPTRAIQKNSRYYVKMIDSKGYEWNKLLEIK